MSTYENSALYRARALHFTERAKTYEALGFIRIAEDLRDVAREFAKAADWLNQPGIADRDAESEKRSIQ